MNQPADMDRILEAYRQAGASPASLAYWRRLFGAAGAEPPAPEPDAGGHTTALLGVLRKLTRLSERLAEMEHWLETRSRLEEPPASGLPPAPGARGPITLGNLGEHIAREAGW